MPENQPPKKMPTPPPFPGGAKPPMKLPGIPSGMRPPAAPPSGAGGSAPTLPAAGVQADPEKLKKLEQQAQELEDSKRKLEKTLADMENKLKEEKEKALYQAMKAREEESLSLKMEQALKEMQDKSRVARREQELEEARLRAEEKVKELERRLNEERETWVINLKKQMEMRDSETRQVETQLESRFRDLEHRWVEEKSMLTQALKSKEDEIVQLRQAVAEVQTQAKRVQDGSTQELELTRRKLEQEFQFKNEELVRERKTLADRLESRERELVSLKAQMAMIDSQVSSAHESSIRTLQEKERSWQTQLSDLQKDLANLKQHKDQLQIDLTRSVDENGALRREMGEWQRNLAAAEQRIQELKHGLAQAEDRARETILKLGEDLRRKTAEKESLEKQWSDERQGWIRKLDDKDITEKSLRETLRMRDEEAASLKNELMIMESEIRRQFEQEKSLILEKADVQLQKELGMRMELVHQEMTRLHEAVIADLDKVDREIQKEKQSYQGSLEAKEGKLVEALNRLRELEAEASRAQDAHRRDLESLRVELESERARDFEAFEMEKQKAALEFEKTMGLQREHWAEELRQAKEESEQAAGKLEKKEESAPKPDLPAAAFPRIPSEGLPPLGGAPEPQAEKPSFLGAIKRYLTRTVIVVSLRPVPRIHGDGSQG